MLYTWQMHQIHRYTFQFYVSLTSKFWFTQITKHPRILLCIQNSDRSPMHINSVIDERISSPEWRQWRNTNIHLHCIFIFPLAVFIFQFHLLPRFLWPDFGIFQEFQRDTCWTHRFHPCGKFLRRFRRALLRTCDYRNQLGRPIGFFAKFQMCSWNKAISTSVIKCYSGEAQIALIEL